MSKISYATPIELEPAAADAAIIILHGLGANGDDLLPLARMLRSAHPQARCVLPTATDRSVTVNNGMRMPAWYDIAGPDFAAERRPSGLEESSTYVMNLVNAQRLRGITPARIVIVGFSQGGALALHTALQNSAAMSAVAALCAYLPAGDFPAATTSLSILMAHGIYDEVVPLAAAMASKTTLTELGYRVRWHEYAIGHQLSDPLIADVSAWLAGVLKN